jgi:hypothetical protein
MVRTILDSDTASGFPENPVHLARWAVGRLFNSSMSVRVRGYVPWGCSHSLLAWFAKDYILKNIKEHLGGRQTILWRSRALVDLEAPIFKCF